MHAKIIEIKQLLQENNFTYPFNISALFFLKSRNITATEAAITLSEVYKMSDEHVTAFVYDSKIWEQESYEDIAYQTILYLFNGEQNSESTTIKINLNLNK